MGTESIEASFLSIFALISFFIFLIISKYSHKIRGGALLDKDFSKPQAFHDHPVTRSGGIAVIISLSFFFVIYYLLYSKILYNYIFISYSVFLVGFLSGFVWHIVFPEYMNVHISVCTITSGVIAWLCARQSEKEFEKEKKRQGFRDDEWYLE